MSVVTFQALCCHQVVNFVVVSLSFLHAMPRENKGIIILITIRVLYHCLLIIELHVARMRTKFFPC